VWLMAPSLTGLTAPCSRSSPRVSNTASQLWHQERASHACPRRLALHVLARPARGTQTHHAAARFLRCAGIKQKAFQQTEMLASKGKNLAKGVKVDVPIDLAKNTGGCGNGMM